MEVVNRSIMHIDPPQEEDLQKQLSQCYMELAESGRQLKK